MNTYEHRTPASLKSEAAYLRQLEGLARNAAEQIDELAERAGMDAMSVQIALGPLELAGLARRRGELWSRPASVAS